MVCKQISKTSKVENSMIQASLWQPSLLLYMSRYQNNFLTKSKQPTQLDKAQKEGRGSEIEVNFFLTRQSQKKS